MSFILILTLGLAATAKTKSEPGVPYEPDTTVVPLGSLSEGRELKLEFNLSLPGNQGLSKNAPSFVAVYERLPGKNWTETQKFDLNSIFGISDMLSFSKQVTLRDDRAEVALFSTIYHCDKFTKKRCYIQGFLGKMSRKRGSEKQGRAPASRTVPFYITGKMN